MSRVLVGVAGLLLVATGPLRAADERTEAEEGQARHLLRVCADPNNLPFSNRAREGFENALARLVATALDAELRYTWWPVRRGFIRNTLRAGKCDVVMGVPSDYELALTTRPYYESTYVFVSRQDRGYDIASFDDPQLRELRIGVHLIGDDYTSTPASQALIERGIIDEVVGYSVYGDYREPNPPAAIVEAVAQQEVDIAIAWGPIAGYFAAKQAAELRLTPVSPADEQPSLPFAYAISMGVRRGDTALMEELNRVIERNQAEIDRVLHTYGVPRVGG